ncbi:MAG: VWA domain-containing protein [Phycisphaerales bacterium]|jgi:Ca-activated chloride channel family protein|nr:VWA domain-containing protein [Phycisphaerales bacterium]
MVISPSTAMMIALAAALLVAVAQWLHRRRVARISHLAFGPADRPAAWVPAAAPLRVAGMALVVWGLIILAVLDPKPKNDQTPRETSKHLLIAFDVSPSMLLEDAGPAHNKMTRSRWAGELVQGVLDRLDPATTRISMVAIYTDALPIFKETFDKEVIRNAMDGLPLYAAFQSGPTKLEEGVVKAFDVAKPWLKGSATLLVVSDGDSTPGGQRPRPPASIADTIVIGVGDPHHPSPVAGHQSKQNTTSLKQLAARLGGSFHQGNTHHLPSEMLDALTMIQPQLGDSTGLRELAILSTVVGALLLAGIPPALSAFGVSRSWARSRRGVMARGAA